MVALHNQEYEQIILGALLRDNNKIDMVVQYVTAESFYFSLHKAVFNAIIDFIGENVEATLINVGEKLKRRGDVAEIYNAPHGDITFYCRTVRDLAIRRSVLEVDERVKREAQDMSKSVEAVVEKADSEISGLLDVKASTFKPVSEFLKPALSLIEEKFKNGGISGVRTGYKDLDDLLGGFQPSDLIIIGARTSVGKTAFALNVAENMAKKNIPVGVISLEMSGKQITERLMCGAAQIELWKINAGLYRGDFDRLFVAAEEIDAYPLYIYDQPNSTLFDIKLKARRMRRKHNIQCLFVDYISLIHIAEQKPHWEKMMDITRELKSLARELQIPVVALSQVTRDAEGKAPSLADLRYGGSVEQDADVVLMLHRDREKANGELHIKKNRQGPCGMIPVRYIMARMRFELRESA